MSASAHAAAAEPRGLSIQGKVGMWAFLSGEVTVFGGLIAVYGLFRLAHPEWAAEAAHTFTPAGALNAIILLGSSFVAVAAAGAAHAGDGKKAARLLRYVVLCGVAFLCVKAFEYSHEIHEGFTPKKSLFWSFYFVMTGLHGLHVVGGLVAMLAIARSAAKGMFLRRVEYVGMYWHVVDVVWIVLFPTLYVVR